MAVHVPLLRQRVPSLMFEIERVWSLSITDAINHAVWCSAVTFTVDVQSTPMCLQPVMRCTSSSSRNFSVPLLLVAKFTHSGISFTSGPIRWCNCSWTMECILLISVVRDAVLNLLFYFCFHFISHILRWFTQCWRRCASHRSIKLDSWVNILRTRDKMCGGRIAWVS